MCKLSPDALLKHLQIVIFSHQKGASLLIRGARIHLHLQFAAPFSAAWGCFYRKQHASASAKCNSFTQFKRKLYLQ